MNTIFESTFFQGPAATEADILQLFAYQFEHNAIYQQYATLVGKTPATVHRLDQIPFLPISFFKSHPVVCGSWEPALVFESSGTTQTINSKHYVRDATRYEQSFLAGFRSFYGEPSEFVILGLLPNYLERKGSSLVYMVDQFIALSNHPASGYYLYNHDELHATLEALQQNNQKVLLIGVTFALLDFAEKYACSLGNTLVMETGGMKGRREEWTRQQLHHYLQERLGVSSIHAEYGMTELLSQAYSYEKGLFQCPHWMQVYVRDEHDPFALQNKNASGLLNIIDLANTESCAFIATDDIGRIHADGRFEVLGRVDRSALRGCSLMVS